MLAYSMLLASLVNQNTNCFSKQIENRMGRIFVNIEQPRRHSSTSSSSFDKSSQSLLSASSGTAGQASTRSATGQTKDKSTTQDAWKDISFSKIFKKDDKAIVIIELGKDIKKFNANIETKKAGFNRDQITIQTTLRDAFQAPQNNQVPIANEKDYEKKQDIVINVIGNYLAIDQKTQQKTKNKIKAPAITKENNNTEIIEAKEKSVPKIEKYESSYQSSFSQMSKTLSKKLDIEKAELEYDEKEGILTIEIPHIKEDKKLGKKINVKIKKNKENLETPQNDTKVSAPSFAQEDNLKK